LFIRLGAVLRTTAIGTKPAFPFRHAKCGFRWESDAPSRTPAVVE
jgi:hypothetical protein